MCIFFFKFNCCRRELIFTFCSSLPDVSEPQIVDMFLAVDNATKITVLVADNRPITVYSSNKKPIIIYDGNGWFPTVFLLWQFPDLLKSFTTQLDGFDTIKDGEDFTAQKLVTPPEGYGHFEKNAPVYLNLTTHRSAIAVGLTMQSSAELQENGGKGNFLKISHFFNDRLCLLDCFKRQMMPELTSTDVKASGEGVLVVAKKKPQRCTSTSGAIPKRRGSSGMASTVFGPLEDMNYLMEYSMLKLLKCSKALELPIRTALFYDEMIRVCPSNRPLDVRKTTWKICSIFIKDMESVKAIIYIIHLY